jgi:hypothetical protein
MKKILIPIILLAFVSLCYGQAKKPTPKKSQSISSVRISAEFLSLHKQRRELVEKLKPLQVRYSEDYPQIQAIQSEIKAIDEKLSKISPIEPISDSEIFGADIDSNQLMKIIVIQNQKIIELLQTLVDKK